MNIDIQNEFNAPNLPTQRIIDAIGWVLRRHQAPDYASITMVITDDEEVRALNQQFRQVDAATDILSFAADPIPDEIREAMEAEGEWGELGYLGDLIVAYPYSQHQAAEAGHDLDDSLVLLGIHGTLHLLGYDHDTPENQERMWMAQSEALAAAGINIEIPYFTFGDEGDSA
jgi:probable rRNA maturation factor